MVMTYGLNRRKGSGEAGGRGVHGVAQAPRARRAGAETRYYVCL